MLVSSSIFSRPKKYDLLGKYARFYMYIGACVNNINTISPKDIIHIEIKDQPLSAYI